MVQDPSRYKAFKAADFLADEYFATTRLAKNVEDVRFWESLISLYPEVAAEMELADQWIGLLRQQPVFKSSLNNEARWQRMKQALPSYEKQQNRRHMIRRYSRWTARVAAVLVSVFMLYEVSQMGTQVTNTAYGERRSMHLPDESIVQLNSNSKLKYVRDWKSDKPREVWLDGEAMFEVQHTAIKNRLREDDYFIVHVGELSLTVLGTKFNVKDRRDLIEVTLIEGSVQIENGFGLKRVLHPGETFVYNSKQDTEQVITEKIDKALSWTRGEMLVEHQNLSDIIEVLEDNYGYSVELKDSSFLNRRLTGVIPLTKVDDILFVIRHTMDLKIDKQGKKIIINTK